MSNYNKQPYIESTKFNQSHSWQGYTDIVQEIQEKIKCIKNNKVTIVIDFYPGVRINEIKNGIINKLNPSSSIYSDECIFIDDEKINQKIKDIITEDRVFGIMNHYSLQDFVDYEKLENIQKQIQENNKLTVVYGVGASLITKGDIYIYADLARWEIQQRYRSKELSNWKIENHNEDILKKYKRGFFFEWRIADKHKKENFDNFNYLLDTNIENNPKMITSESYFETLKEATNSPFRVVPFFDPGVWGGQWMKEVCDLDRSKKNYAWCFDCVPEENSLLVKVGDVVFESPSINMVFKHPKELLGEHVHARFGTEFPIRFDFLDTMEGQNLSLQVHPLTEYIQEQFGMKYTQDESYYILDAKDGANVYLGVKNNIDKNEFFENLEDAQEGNSKFDAEKFVNKIPAKKHDHFLIPAGTAHCSGKDTMVLEISSTPYIFTFKLWDWDRLGTDGKPRPIHLEHGKNVLQFDRDTDWTYKNLVNRVEVVDKGKNWIEERTGLHEREFIETRRHWFSGVVNHDTKGNLNVLNLIEGHQAIVKSLENKFEPYLINYSETFIVPANVGKYTIEPYGESVGKTIATIKAYVR